MKVKDQHDSFLWLEYALLSCLLFLFFFSATQASLTEAPDADETALLGPSDPTTEASIAALSVLDGDHGDALPELEPNDNEDTVDRDVSFPGLNGDRRPAPGPCPPVPPR